MQIGVVTFPGSLDDRDAQRAVRLAGGEAVALWHADPDLHGVDAVVLPGGFSYGDHLRAGALARFSPVMTTVAEQARAGLPVLGICNGFQVLCESHLLPGALTRNQALRFVNRDQRLRIANRATAWTADLPEQHHPNDVHDFRCGDPESAAELTRQAQPAQHGRNLRASAVHDDGMNSDGA